MLEQQHAARYVAPSRTKAVVMHVENPPLPLPPDALLLDAGMSPFSQWHATALGSGPYIHRWRPPESIVQQACDQIVYKANGMTVGHVPCYVSLPLLMYICYSMAMAAFATCLTIMFLGPLGLAILQPGCG
jgi:hypothetical protein